MPVTARTAAAAVTLALMLVGLCAAPVGAHALLRSADPADGTGVPSAPEQVTLTFNEPVRASTGAVRVFDASATRVDDGLIETGDPTVVAVALPPQLPDGGYVVTYRVVSADSHPVDGVVTFTVGRAEQVDRELIADLFGGVGNRWTGVVGPVLRGLSYLGVLVAAGAVLYAATVAVSAADRRSARRTSTRAAVLGLVATAAAAPVHAAAVTGRSPLGTLSPGGGLGEVLFSSSYGQGTLVRAVGLGALLAVWRRVPDTHEGDDAPDGAGTRTGAGVSGCWIGPGLAGALAVGSFVLDGHQRSVEPTWLLVGADVVHLFAGAAWLAGLVLLAVAVRARHLDDAPISAAQLVVRFGRLATGAVLAVTLAGGALSWALVRTPRALVSTSYGWTLVAKLALVAVVVLAALYNNRRLVPAVAARLVPAGAATDTVDVADRVQRRSNAAWRQLRVTLLVEVVGIVAVLAVTGFLVSQRPAAEAAGITAAFEGSAALTDDLRVDLLVDPNRAGRNALHVYVLDADGLPTDEVEELRLELTYVPDDIGPFRVEPYAAGPGHWTAVVDDLTFPGPWSVRVLAGLDRFTEVSTEMEVVVNPDGR